MIAAAHDLPPLKQAFFACKGGFGAVLVFSLCINLLMLTVPLYMLQIFDRVLSSRSADTLIMLLIIATVALLVMASLDAVRSILLIRLGTWLEERLGPPVLSESISAELGSRGGTVQGLRDLTTVRNFLTGPGIFPVMDAPWAPVFIAVIFLLHPTLGWLSLGGALILFGMGVVNEVVTRDPLMRSGGAALAAVSEAETAVRNADVVEAMGMMPNVLRRWRTQNAQAGAFQAKASNVAGAITAVSKFLRLVLQIAILTTGAWLVLKGELTAGGMIAGSILMSRALAPVEQAIGAWKGLVAARQAYARIAERLNAPSRRGGGMPLPTPSGAVSVESVVFAYRGVEQPLIRGVSFTLKPGEVMGLIGPTAAGKTTLARLLVGNLQPRNGHVRLDNMDVAQWDHDDLGPHIGYLPQDVELFTGTVRENIARLGEGSPEQVVAAARLAGVHDMILGLPKGYDTPIGPAGAALSGGQRQRIGLARALYGEPRFVVLDEPNASLDREGEVALLRAISTLKKKRVTLVIIAHRPSILRLVDSILALKNGTVMMHGPRDEIIAKLTTPAGGAAPGGDEAGPAAGAAQATQGTQASRPQVLRRVPGAGRAQPAAQPKDDDNGG